MRLNNFLLNESRSIKISENDCIEMIKKDYMDAIHSKNRIYRGNNEDAPFLYIKPSNYERESPYAVNNYYNLLLSNLPSWSKYPKRNKSVICTTEYDVADRYKNSDFPYLVLPKDGAEIGVCPENDIWFSFRGSGIHVLNDLNDVLKNIIKVAAADEKIRDYKHLEMVLKNIYYDEEEDTEIYSIFKQFQIIIKDYPKTSLFNLINDLLSPVDNDFKVTNIKNRIPDGLEVWISDPCILICADEQGDEVMKKFFNYVIKKG
jgi:hypothetical protein